MQSTDRGLLGGRLVSIDALRNWIRAAEAVRSTCLSPHAFDALIRYQRRRLEGLMDQDIKAAIRLNITSLFDSAELLASREYYGPAIHLLMAAREECVKWILVYCWAHLDEKSRTKIFSHEFKHKTSGIFYFMSGQLQALDFVIGGIELLKTKDPKLGKVSARLISLLPGTIDDPDSIAKSIRDSLSYADSSSETEETKTKREAALKKLVDDAEELRQHSIYVDFNSALTINGQPQNLKKEDYEKIKKDVILARYHIDKLSGLNPKKDVLHSTFPEWKEELEKSLRKLSSDLEDVNPPASSLVAPD
jgi:hypothetical protein